MALAAASSNHSSQVTSVSRLAVPTWRAPESTCGGDGGDGGGGGDDDDDSDNGKSW